MELVICETFFPVAWKIIVEKNKNIIIMLFVMVNFVSFEGKGVGQGLLKGKGLKTRRRIIGSKLQLSDQVFSVF